MMKVSAKTLLFADLFVTLDELTLVRFVARDKLMELYYK